MIQHRRRDRPNGAEEERLFDLMRERAVHGLSDADERELERLARAHPDIDVECYDRAAAALDIVFSERRAAQMPSDVRQRIAALSVAPQSVAPQSVVPQSAAPQSAAPQSAAPQRVVPTPTPRTNEPPSGGFAWAGWIVAAAATIVAILGWTREPAGPERAEVVRELQREVDAAADRVVLPWKPTDDPAGRQVAGELHWSTSLQKGYMRFRGLAANDPTETQYQLWIFDKPRGTDHPVDGGVFDVAQGDVVVPIDAKIYVNDPALFAVTAEEAGGVVVSKRERIVSLAEL